MAKKLKKWNGRGQGEWQGGHISIAAYSQKQAAELLGKVTGYTRGNLTEIREYFSPCWGNDMEGVEPTEPCVYGTTKENRWGKAERII